MGILDEQRIREEKIRDLLVKLSSANELVSQEAFNSICLYFFDRDIDIIYESLAYKADTQSIYWLIKYLVSVERPYGFEKILLLLDNENEAIREEAVLAVSKIDVDSRIELLVRMLSFKWEEVVCSSATALGELAVTKATLPLLELLEKSAGKEKVSIAIVRALGKIRDMRAFVVLERMVKETTGKLQEEALFALSKYTRKVSFKYLKKCLQSEDLGIKKIAYLAVIKFKPRGWENIISNGLLNETDQELKIRILSSLSVIDSSSLFRVIFNLACGQKSSILQTMAESVIRRLKSRRIFTWLLHLQKGSSAREEENFLKLISDYQEEGVVFSILKRYYLNSKENKFKLLSIECMGKIRDERAYHFLRDIIREKGPFSYSASLSLRGYINSARRELLNEMLLLDPKIYSLEIQVFLNFILSLPQENPLLPELEACVEKLLGSGIRQLRLLAVRCLERSGNKNSFLKLLDMITIEHDPLIRSSILKSLRFVLNKSPEHLEIILGRFFQEPHLFSATYMIFGSVSVSKESFDKLLEILFEYFRKNKGALEASRLDLAHLILLLKALSTKHKLFFVEHLREAKLNDDEYWMMMKVINLTDIHEASGLGFDFMAEQCRRGSKNTRAQYLSFFQKLPHPSRKIMLEVFSEFGAEENILAREKAEQAISSWLSKSVVN
ncbi:MAG: hypothetical protein PHY94_01210 [Candidatus Omnitrophica bacterium]|nr:hypothetical protein [Candidatus Omnitrophota bacterium]